MLLLMTQKTMLYSTIKTSIYISLCIGFFGLSQSFAQTYTERLDGLLGSIDDFKDFNQPEKILFTNAIDKFCEAMTSWEPMWVNNLTYNAKNSIFMYRLCTDNNPNLSITRWPWLTDAAETSYVQFEDDKDGNKIDVLKNQLPNVYQKTEEYIQTLFDTIAESYTTIYQASIYGKKWDDSQTNSKLIEEFSQMYLSDAGNPSPMKYISLCATDQKYSYPKTCDKLTNYLKNANNSLNSSSNILNTTTLYNDRSTSKNTNCDPNNPEYNTISCGLYENDMTKFVNLVYNELFFYTSFVQYYVYILNTQDRFKANNQDDDIENNRQREDRISLMTENLSNSREATKIGIKLLKELQMTFPIHIWLLMYTEAINTFVQNFNKTLIPIYTLWDIFRNVQDTK